MSPQFFLATVKRPFGGLNCSIVHLICRNTKYVTKKDKETILIVVFVRIPLSTRGIYNMFYTSSIPQVLCGFYRGIHEIGEW